MRSIPSPPPLRVLIAEAHPIVVLGLTDILRRLGYVLVGSVASGQEAQCWQNPRRSGWPEASSDEVGQVWNGGLVWDGEPSAEVVPERHSELLASFHQAQERIPAIPAHVAAGSAADLAPGHLGPDVVL